MKDRCRLMKDTCNTGTPLKTAGVEPVGALRKDVLLFPPQ